MAELRMILTVAIATAGASLAALAIWLTVRLVNHPQPWAWLSRAIRPVALKSIIGYFVVSTLTLPSLDRFWIGELAVLALIQLPKVLLAGWLRTEVFMKGMKLAGLSKGSFSPDYLAARFWALLAAYLIVLGTAYFAVWNRTRMAEPYRRLAWILLAVAAFDFVVTLVFAGGPGFSIY